MKSFKQFFVEQTTAKTAVFAYGRFNPPTTGHEKLIKVVTKATEKYNADGFIIPSHSTEPKNKNPLTFEQKASVLKYIVSAPLKLASFGSTFINVLKELQALGYTNVIQIAGSDRQAEFLGLVNKYNGRPDPKTGNIDFNFRQYNVVSSGERDPDSDSIEGMSASKLRMLAIEGNFEQFARGMSSAVPNELKRQTYETIRKTLNKQ